MRPRLLIASACAAVLGVPFVVHLMGGTTEPTAWQEWRTRQRLGALLAEHAEDRPPGERTALVRALADAQRELGIDPLLLVAVIERESRFDARARGPRGGLGLMQVRPSTARDAATAAGLRFERDDELFDPRLNVGIGAKYLSEMKERFGTWELALVAYNAGPTRVARELRAGRRPRSRYARSVVARWKELAAAEGGT